METGILDWLANVGATAFRWSALAFLVVNGIAVAAVVLTRDRALVNRWTGRLLAINLGLVGTGLGIPLLTTVSRVAVAAVLPTTQTVLPTITRDEDLHSDGRAVELKAKD